MILARREFLRLLGVSVVSGSLGCGRDWLIPDERIARALRGPGIESEEATICGLCGGGCGLRVRLVDGMPVGLRGNPSHPLNQGGLCPIGQAGLDILYAPDRLQGPMRRDQGGALAPTSWDQALNEIGAKLAGLRSEGKGDRIAFLVDGKSALLYELAQRFAQSLGSVHVATPFHGNVLPYRLTQGIHGVPGFDLAHADVVLSFGFDLYQEGPSPIHAIAALVGARPGETRARILHVGTRLSPTAAKAEEHLSIDPGSHGALALGLAHVLVREDRYDREFVKEHTFGFEDWSDDEGNIRLGFRRMLLERYYPDRVARICGCKPQDIIHLARRFASASSPVAVVGGEAVSGSNATWTGMAVHALNALVGAFDRDGGVMLPPRIPLTPLEPLPGQPADPLQSLFFPQKTSLSMDLDPIDAIVQNANDGSRPIEILFILEVNPVHDSAAGQRLRQVFEQIPMVVVMSPFEDETAARADYVLPSHLFLEAWHEASTPPMVPMSVLGLAHPVIEPLFDTRHPGDVVLDLARRTDESVTAALPWDDYLQYMKYRLQHLESSGQGSVISGSFEASWIQYLEERGWRFLQHAGFEEFWKNLTEHAGWWNPVVPPANWERLFHTKTGRYEFFSRALEQHLLEIGSDESKGASRQSQLQSAIKKLGLQVDEDEACLPHYEPPVASNEGELTLAPFTPITGRSNLSAASSMLLEMFGYTTFSGWETWVELAPETADEHGVEHGDVVALVSDRGSLEAVVRVHPGSTPGLAHVPLGLGHTELNSVARSVGSNPLTILHVVRDPLSGNLSLNSTRVHLRLVRRREHGGPPPLAEGHA